MHSLVRHALVFGWSAMLLGCSPKTIVNCPDCPASPPVAKPTMPQGDVEVRHFANAGFDHCNVIGKPLKIQTDRSNLWMTHYDSAEEEHFRIQLPMWVAGDRLLVTARNDKRSLGLVIGRNGATEFFVGHEKQNVDLQCQGGQF